MGKILLTLFCLLSLTLSPNERFLYVGDSLTCYKGGWQDQVTNEFKASSTNLSVGGKRTSWMLSVLSQHLQQNKNYTRVFIYGGANDAYSYVSLDGAVKNVQDMVNLCSKNNMIPYVILGYDPESVMSKTIYPEKINSFHRSRYVKLQNMLQTRLTNCRIISICHTVKNSDTGDGIHLKASGHKKFSSFVINEIKKYE